MGQTEVSTVVSEVPFSLANWNVIEVNGQYKVLSHKETLEQIEEYTLRQDLSAQEMTIYNRRRCSNHPFVQVIHVQQNGQRDLCQGPKDFKVYLERTELRLSNMTNLQDHQGLIILRDAYKGFAMCSQHYGPVEAQQDLVAITQRGTVAVWINPNYSLNYPQFKETDQKFGFFFPGVKQAAYVRKLYDFVELRSQMGEGMAELKNQLRKDGLTYWNSSLKAAEILQTYYPLKVNADFKSLIKIDQRTTSKGTQNIGGSKNNYDSIGLSRINCDQIMTSNWNINNNGIISGNNNNSPPQHKYKYKTQPLEVETRLRTSENESFCHGIIGSGSTNVNSANSNSSNSNTNNKAQAKFILSRSKSRHTQKRSLRHSDRPKEDRNESLRDHQGDAVRQHTIRHSNPINKISTFSLNDTNNNHQFQQQINKMNNANSNQAITTIRRYPKLKIPFKMYKNNNTKNIINNNIQQQSQIARKGDSLQKSNVVINSCHTSPIFDTNLMSPKTIKSNNNCNIINYNNYNNYNCNTINNNNNNYNDNYNNLRSLQNTHIKPLINLSTIKMNSQLESNHNNYIGFNGNFQNNNTNNTFNNHINSNSTFHLNNNNLNKPPQNNHTNTKSESLSNLQPFSTRHSSLIKRGIQFSRESNEIQLIVSNKFNANLKDKKCEITNNSQHKNIIHDKSHTNLNDKLQSISIKQHQINYGHINKLASNVQFHKQFHMSNRNGSNNNNNNSQTYNNGQNNQINNHSNNIYHNNNNNINIKQQTFRLIGK